MHFFFQTPKTSCYLIFLFKSSPNELIGRLKAFFQKLLGGCSNGRRVKNRRRCHFWRFQHMCPFDTKPSAVAKLTQRHICRESLGLSNGIKKVYVAPKMTAQWCLLILIYLLVLINLPWWPYIFILDMKCHIVCASVTFIGSKIEGTLNKWHCFL